MTTGTVAHQDNPCLDIAQMSDREVAGRLEQAEYNLTLARKAAERGECGWSVVVALQDRVRELELESMYRHAPGFIPTEMHTLITQMEQDTQRAIASVRLLNAMLLGG